MRTSKQMARIITKIAQAQDFDLTKPGGHFRIENGGYMPLSVDVLMPNVVAVAHNYIQNGDVIPYPDMTFYTGYGVEFGWVPLAIQMAIGTYTRAATMDDEKIVSFNRHYNAELSSFANMWARNIAGQGFYVAACIAANKAGVSL